MADIGIDLGTTNSVLAYLRGGPEVINIKGRPLLPSAIAFDEDEWLVGAPAKSLAATIDNVVTSPKRSMGTDHTYKIAGRSYTPVDMSAMILKEIKKHAEDFLGEPVSLAVITIPAHFAHQSVEDTRKAAEQAGLKVGKLLAEPIAASATYGWGREETILVFDLGGGTLDCTVVDVFDAEILGLSGDNWLGGDNFDRRIVDRMVKHLQDEYRVDVTGDKKILWKLKAWAEEHKIDLSERKSTQVERSLTVNGKRCDISFRLTRDEYNTMIADLVDKTLEKADEAVERANLKKSDIDVILLVGGSTLTPYVQERLAKHFGKPPSKKVDPMLAVGLGAAICTRDLGVVPKTHRVALRSLAEVWSKPTYTIKGRTTPQSRVEVLGGARPADATASSDGQFSVDVALVAGAVNDISVKATTANGDVAKAMHRIRHDAQAGQTVEPPPAPMIQAPLPRNILLGLEKQNVAVLIKAGSRTPTAGETEQFCTTATPQPHTLIGPIYEGHTPEHEIPYGPFNTHMGTLEVKCPPTNSVTPLKVAFEVDESRNITVRCWFRDNPSIRAEVKLNPQAITRDKLHLIERTEQTLNDGGQRIRPDEKSSITRKLQAIKDLCEQYTSDQSEDTRSRIIKTGNELLEEVKAIEQKYKI